MKKLITAMFALAAGVSVAMAADLPSKKAAPAPAVSDAFNLSGWYAGGFVGGNYNKLSGITYDNTSKVFGGVVGYEWNPMIRTEATFDYNTKATPTTTKTGETVFANAVVSYPVFGFSPYVLGGVGYGWNGWAKPNETGSDRVLYNVGGGVRYEFAKNWEIDARYRYIDAIQGTKFTNNNVTTLGVNYKF